MRKQTAPTQQPWTEEQLNQELRAGRLSLPPLQFAQVMTMPDGPRRQIDGVVSANWRGRTNLFGYEYKRIGTPKAIELAAAQVKQYSSQAGISPLIIVPYVLGDRLAALEADGVSAIDL